MTEQGKLNRTLDKVRKLVAKAEHPGTPPAEAQACREMADALMLKYAIDEATVDAAKATDDQGKPIFIDIPLADGDMTGYVGWLATKLAKFTRCKVRNYTAFKDGAWMSRVFGFESDVRYFELLYTTLRLHMLGALRPGVNPDESLEENAYRLHNAGYNWLDMAEFYGWKKYAAMWGSERTAAREANPSIDGIKIAYVNRDNEAAAATKVGGIFKRAYLRAVEAKGEQPLKVAANGGRTYRNSAGQGYIDRLNTRINEQQRTLDREAGQAGALVLSGRLDLLERYWRQMNPDMYTECPECHEYTADQYDCEFCGYHIADKPERAKVRMGRGRAYRPTPHNAGAYAAGVAHANSADLLGSRRAGSANRPGVEQ